MSRALEDEVILVVIGPVYIPLTLRYVDMVFASGEPTELYKREGDCDRTEMSLSACTKITREMSKDRPKLF